MESNSKGLHLVLGDDGKYYGPFYGYMEADLWLAFGEGAPQDGDIEELVAPKRTKVKSKKPRKKKVV